MGEEYAANAALMSRIQRAISSYKMLSDGDTVVVGLSGGADSVMLTHYLKFGLDIKVFACHVNHLLRGEESDRDMDFVVNLCHEWDIPLSLVTTDVASYSQRHKLTIEQAGRAVRYAAFEEARIKFGANKIATAHTLSDNAETMLLNLSRGSGLKGLCGIPPMRDNIIRPLIFITRDAVEEYCAQNGIEYVNDSTNFESVYVRNKMRNEILPHFKEVNPQIFTSISKTIGVISAENEYLTAVAADAYDEARRGDSLLVERLVEFHVAIRRRVISQFLDNNLVEKTNELIRKVDRIVMCDKGKINVSTNIFVEIKKHTLLISDNNKVIDYFEAPLECGEFFDPSGQCYTISICDRLEIEMLKKIYKNLLYISFDYDKIVGKLVIRQRKSGDKITLSKRGGTKSLKKLFIDYKLTAVAKSQVLVVSDEQGVVAVMGYGCDERVVCDENTSHFLIIIAS